MISKPALAIILVIVIVLVIFGVLLLSNRKPALAPSASPTAASEPQLLPTAAPLNPVDNLKTNPFEKTRFNPFE